MHSFVFSTFQRRSPMITSQTTYMVNMRGRYSFNTLGTKLKSCWSGQRLGGQLSIATGLKLQGHSTSLKHKRGINHNREKNHENHIDNIEGIHNEMKWHSNSLDLRWDGVEITSSNPSYNSERDDDDDGGERTKNYDDLLLSRSGWCGGG